MLGVLPAAAGMTWRMTPAAAGAIRPLLVKRPAKAGAYVACRSRPLRHEGERRKNSAPVSLRTSSWREPCAAIE
jgi:hypothetical protein